MIDKDLFNLVKQVKNIMIAKNLTIAVAESCTSGLLASYLTSIEGASKYFSYGFITYSNQAKIDLLNISPQSIERFGVVSQETAEAMALGAMHKAGSSIAVAITGIAGPTGGTPQKPVGTVWVALTAQGEIITLNSYPQTLTTKVMNKKPLEFTSIHHNLIIKSYLLNLDLITKSKISVDKRQIIRYLSCKKALQIILTNIQLANNHP